ncbi:MAG: zinc-dependent metalloprotease [Planctomycetota bacterium]
MLAAAGCGGGGSGSPAATFSFAGPSSTVAEGAAPLPIQVVLHTSLPALTADVSVDVVDLVNGSGVSGTDYAPFATQTITFPAGAMDGDSQTVSLTALADQVVEGTTDTVRLGLQNTQGAGLIAPATCVVSLDDVDVASIQFTLASSATPDESSGPRSIMAILDLPAGVTLGVAATAQVSDSGSGSATSGGDYAAFATQTITFPAGTPDGATRRVDVVVNDDVVVELDEDVSLALSGPSAGAQLGATAFHDLTITDDDASGPPAFVATEGVIGIENSLAYDELVDLGSQGVDDGPNIGTRVRVTNAGGAPMDLGAPFLSGTNAEDFVVEVESAPMPAASPPPIADVAAPIEEMPTVGDSGIAFRFDAAAVAELRNLPNVRMHGFPVPGVGDATLELRRVPLPIAPGAVLRVDGVDVPGGLASAMGDLSVWSGSILEVPGSKVFLALSGEAPRGYLELPFPGNRFVHLVAEAGSAPLVHLVRNADMPAALLAQTADFCAEPLHPPGQAADFAHGAAELPGAEALTAADCRLAIETDYQLYQKFGSVGATTTYVTQMMAAISDQYFTDVQTTLSIEYLGIYSNAADPWTTQDSGGSTNALLDEFRNDWVANGWPVPANLAHFVSGANLGGGIAYLNVLCNSTWGFGVSANISGTVNWGAWTGLPGNFTWDFVVVAHEIGHNFGANHTHSYCPPLDLCYTNCNATTSCSQGTIMSYCHLCGGLDNIDLEFGPMLSNIMRNAVNSSCLGLSALAGGDYVQYLVRFAPWGATGVRNATLQFSHDAPNATQPFRIQLRGTAVP